MPDFDLTSAEEAQLLANTSGETAAKRHLAIARRAALEGRLVAAETHIVAAAAAVELAPEAHRDDGPVVGARLDRDALPHSRPHPAASAALRQLVDAPGVSAFASGIDRVAAQQGWVLAPLPHRILRGEQRPGMDPRSTDMLGIEIMLDAARDQVARRNPRAAGRELHDAAGGLSDLAHPTASQTIRDAALRIDRGALDTADAAFYAPFIEEARDVLMAELADGPADAPWPASVPSWPIRHAVGDLMRAHELLDRDDLAAAVQALERAIGRLESSGARPELAEELAAWLHGIAPDGELDMLVGDSLDAYSGRRDTAVLVDELDTLAAAHGLDGDVRSEIDLRDYYAETDYVEMMLIGRMQSMRVGDEIVLPNGTLVTQDARGYVLDATRRIGVDALVGAAIAANRDEERARVAHSQAGSTLGYSAEQLRSAGALLAAGDIAAAGAAADTAARRLAELGHPAAARIEALAETLRPQISDGQREGVADALRMETARLAWDARFLREVIQYPETAADNCRLEDPEHPFHGPYVADLSPADLSPLAAPVIDRNDAWRREVVSRERAERQRAVRAQGFALHPPSPAAARMLVDLEGEHVVVQLTVARDLLSHDEIPSARTAVAVAVMGLEQSGDRAPLAAELDAWTADFVDEDYDYEHPAYEPTKQAEILLAEIDAIAERHDITLDPASSTGRLLPADLPADPLLERRMNRLQVGEDITLSNGSRVAREEFGYAVDGRRVSADPPVAVRAALERDAGRAGAPNVSGPDVGADVRAARAVAALCQPVPARRAASAAPSATARTSAPEPVDLSRGGGRDAGR